MRSERELLIAAAGQLEVFGEESELARNLADEINEVLGLPKMRQKVQASLPKPIMMIAPNGHVHERCDECWGVCTPERETTAELVSRVAKESK